MYTPSTSTGRGDVQPVSVGELPPPPAGKTGWPWTEGSPVLPSLTPAGQPWPKIAIVTPSFNQGAYIEETIRSVLLQGYPNLEYIIIDGGSTDDTIDIIRKYERYVSYWVSEPDRGQAHAINKGIRRATGDIFAWLNSDDVYAPGVFQRVASIFRDEEVHLLYGKCAYVEADGRYRADWPYVGNLNLPLLLSQNVVPQPSTFLRMHVVRGCGFLDEQMHYAFDYEYWLRIIAKNYRAHSIPNLLSYYRLHDTSKTQTARYLFDEEMKQAHQRFSERGPQRVMRRAIATCYRRFSLEHYFWYCDRSRSIFWFHEMLRTDPFACNWLALKVYVKNLLGKQHVRVPAAE